MEKLLAFNALYRTELDKVRSEYCNVTLATMAQMMKDTDTVKFVDALEVIAKRRIIASL